MSPPPEGESTLQYVAARRILLDALEALKPHEGAVVLAGAGRLPPHRAQQPPYRRLHD